MLDKYYNKETKKLNIPYNFNKKLKNLPPDVKIIIFKENYIENQRSKFNIKIKNLPLALTHLTFPHCFNQPVDNLPPNLTHLTFGNDFNQPVDNLPPNLTHLTVGENFDQPLNNLPPMLQELHMFEDDQQINMWQLKIPFGCKVFNFQNKEVIL
jgi:hypothetical protein